jgi:hypothetical protein
LDGDIPVFQQTADAQPGVVRLNDSGADLRARPYGERNLGFFTIVNRQTLQHQASETGTGTTSASVVHKESLQASAVIRQFTDSVQAQVNDFFSDSVVTTSEVVSSIFLTRDQLLRVKQLPVRTGAHFIDDSRFQVNKDSSWNVLASTGFGKEGVESVVTSSDGLVGRHLSIRLDSVFQTEQFPASISDLDTGLPNMNANGFSHRENVLVLSLC